MKQTDVQNNTTNDKKRLKEILEILMNNEATKPLNPEKLRFILQDLGPYFIKLGEILSNRQDILPKEFREELSKLQDVATPMSYEELQRIIEHEYGVFIDVIFTEFDETPIELSSITQTHAATLQDGSPVTVKFQKPEVYNNISKDISLLRKALSVLRLESSDDSKINLNFVLDELWSVCQQELNFLAESENTEKFYNLNSNNSLVCSPRIDSKYTTANILVIEHVDGIKIKDIEHLSSMGYDLNEIAVNLANNYAKQFLYDGFFHASPNGDNILIKNGKIIWTNFSLMGTLSQKEIESLARGINAAKKKDIVDLKGLLLSVSVSNGEVNNSKLYTSIEQMFASYNDSAKAFNLSNVVKDIVILLNENDLSLPEQFSKLCIGLISMESILNTLSPKFSMISLFCDVSNNNEENDETSKCNEVDENPVDNLETTKPVTEKIQKEEQVISQSKNSSQSQAKNSKDFDIHEFQANQANQINKAAELSNQKLNMVSQNQNQQPSLSYDTQEKTVDMVAQLSDILKMAIDGKTKINLQVNISDNSLSSVDKILNKLIICIISVSCLIGACTLIATDLEPKLFDLPAIGLLLFIISIILLGVLIIRIIKRK